MFQVLNHDEFNAFIKVTQHYIDVQHRTKTSTTHCKLRNITASLQKKQKPIVVPVPFVNLSSMEFSNEEHHILSLGPKFMFHNKMNLKSVVDDWGNITYFYTE